MPPPGAMEQEGNVSVLHLLDVPTAWLVQLVSGEYCGEDSICSLLQTCRTCFQLILENRPLTIITLPVLSIGPLNAVHVLMLAGQHARNISLQLKDWCSDVFDEQHHSMVASLYSQSVCNFLQAAQAMDATNAISELHVQGGTFDSALPHLGQACPNLKVLKLTYADIHLGHASALGLITAHTTLECLELHRVQFLGTVVQQQQYSLRQQLQGLPALQSLTRKSGGDPLDINEILFVNALATQLTHLRLDSPNLYHLSTRLNWTGLGTSLQHLQLPNIVAGDSVLRVLLQLPHLTHVGVDSFQLGESYAGWPCRWLELEVRSLDVPALARLPLPEGLVFKRDPLYVLFGFLGLHFPFSSTVEDVQKAVANASKFNGMAMAQCGVNISGVPDDADPASPGQLLLAALPLLTGVQEVECTCAPRQLYPGMSPSGWVQFGASLMSLQLPGVEATGEDLKLLLDLPQLTNLHVASFKLEESYAGWPCKWRQLNIYSISLQGLAHLPLHDGLILEVGRLREKLRAIDLYLPPSLYLVQQAVDNTAKCGSFRWHRHVTDGLQPVSVVGVPAPRKPATPGRVLIEALPLLKGVKRLEVHDVHLAAPVLEALSSFMHGTEGFKRLLLSHDCMWKAQDLIQLIPTMPLDCELVLHAQREKLIKQMCCAAQRKLTLRVLCDKPLCEGYMDRIQSAMQLCGHQHTTLVVQNSGNT